MASAAVHHPGMASQLDFGNAPSSLTARRQAASNLPNFELPPPQLSQKYLPFSAINTTQQPAVSNVSVGNLLTPPSNNPIDNLNSGPTTNPNGTSNTSGIPPYTPNGLWPMPATGTTPFGMGTGTTPQPWAQVPFNPLFPPRGMFSPSLGSLMRNNTNSPNASDSLPPPPFDLNQLPPFPTSLPMSAPASLPAVTAQHQAMAQAYMNLPTPISASTTQSMPMSASEAYMQRPPPTPTYYSSSQPSSTPQQSQFSPYAAPSPSQQSPTSGSAPPSRVSPMTHGPPSLQTSTSAPVPPFSRSFPPYTSGGLPGHAMSNLHSPGGQLALVGGLPGGMMPGFNSGHAAHMQQMYGNQQQSNHNDRPFKCDQCPQSFNRNHDLKRHKRIHLAVKPFPCGHCEKSFSRKDALKRHILVKGCGKAGSSEMVPNDDGSTSPVAKSEPMSSDNDDSPVRNTHL